ncbi:unnamed protein product [Rotaria socialis]|uniref:Uncharacterized protein n=1 Tax=Rotaria socialis TaxID=392032 RepID=A0A820GNZ2_9BILA|nr:unnamed protein product [Rotaria socialis]CAF3459516.1 unnamed protein product [Rotaria socialis]CAF3506379.1 unnamed protein product [Rotaria socialis]CAF3517937.1 unnamed protein product [Rotaria socialis]CAF4280730.1 unnamed protein product [Rotaria socialis]
MNSISLSLLVNLLILLVVSFHLTSSASFPNPPQRPPSNASPDEQALFWKLLHNYYAIIARPRFGKRFSPASSYSKHAPFLPTANPDSIGLLSSAYNTNRMLNKNIPNANDQRTDDDNFYVLEYADQRRRRRL